MATLAACVIISHLFRLSCPCSVRQDVCQHISYLQELSSCLNSRFFQICTDHERFGVGYFRYEWNYGATNVSKWLKTTNSLVPRKVANEVIEKWGSIMENGEVKGNWCNISCYFPAAKWFSVKHTKSIYFGLAILICLCSTDNDTDMLWWSTDKQTFSVGM